MVHYPKASLKAISHKVLDRGGFVGLETRKAISKYAKEHLSSQAMASYILRSVGQLDRPKVLFVDESLEKQPDYLSLLTLIGMKQILGKRCEEYPLVDYIYSDWKGDASKLYGRGFGYVGILDPDVRAAQHTPLGLLGQSPDLATPDLLIVGNISRNASLGKELLSVFPAQQTIWLHGEDSPPGVDEIRFLRQSGCHVFVRSIEPPGTCPRRRGYSRRGSPPSW